MSEVNLERMLEICSRFVDGNPLDFYQLFSIDKNMNLMEINKDIKNKKIRVLFHPDQLNVVPDEYKTVFQKISNSIPDLVNAFSTRENREKYDSSLAKSKEPKPEPKMEEPPRKETKESETVIITGLDRKNLESAVIHTAAKYGWEHLINALEELITNGTTNRFTREGNSRDYIKQLGRDKIRDMVFGSSYEDINKGIRLDTEQIIANYISEIMKTNPILSQQANALTNAMTQTINKYGEEQGQKAIQKYATTGDANSITSTGNARRNLETFIRPDDVKIMLALINNQERFAPYSDAAVNRYSNTKNQSISYHASLASFNIRQKQRQQYEQETGYQY